MAVRRALGRIASVWQYRVLSPPSTLSVFPIVSRFITWATSSGSSPSQASQAGPVNLLKTRGPCNRAAREQKPQFHFPTITLELARLGSSELRWWIIVLLIGF